MIKEIGKNHSPPLKLNLKNIYMNFNFDWISFLLGIIAGAVAGLFLAYYFLKRYMEKKMQDVSKLMKKEEIRQLASAFGRNLSEQQINMIAASMEKAMEQATNKPKNKKK